MQRLSLQTKAFLTLTILLAVMMMMFIGFSRVGLQRGLGPYVAEIELARMDWLVYRLQDVYQQNGSWTVLKENPALWRAVRRPLMNLQPETLGNRPTNRLQHSGMAPQPSANESPVTQLAPPPEPPPPSASPALASDGLARRLALLDADQTLIAGAPALPGSARTPLKDDAGRTIGYLIMNPPEGLEREADKAFLEKQLGFVLGTGAAGLLLALLLSVWLAHRWLRPIGVLMSGAKSLASGQLQTRIPEQTDSEEFSRLIHTFNDMAQQLDSMETSRRQWIGDMAHELRTPLTAMRAEIEAVQDGVRHFDAHTAERLHRQLMRLIQLVGDLRESVDSASIAPAKMEPMLPMLQLKEAIVALQTRFEQAGVSIELREPREWALAAHAPRVLGNAQQLHRVFLNLIENSLRYTDSGGRLQIACSVHTDRAGRTGDQFLVVFDDTKPGVSLQELPHLFERLYRTESSRQRATGDLGGSGLGLAICRSIVQAHGGQIDAAQSPLGGLRITLTLALMEK
ncbi:ATP-binding protein [Diaphorobacter aerolatus]|uniref:histidine kinase n=1 Tax=Diaphorobacter aerolatus TaxID=1288495 RepID=A0A7H0GJ15_9BURK|nr:ATP-binding protein [Diaphorobacter aerolatus]QNP48281.1 HAMP domain-containing protein [Diaphorobacter aerolatus]